MPDIDYEDWERTKRIMGRAEADRIAAKFRSSMIPYDRCCYFPMQKVESAKIASIDAGVRWGARSSDLPATQNGSLPL